MKNDNNSMQIIIPRHNDAYTKIEGEIVRVPISINKGLLKLCPEGKRLYDEYCEVYDDESKSDAEMLVMWDAYYEHRMNCDDCGYV